ncbi:hypothetical protein BH24ACT5_BH24ACT5_02140 [soil metagenome]
MISVGDMATEVVTTASTWDSEFWGERTGRIHVDTHDPPSLAGLCAAIASAQKTYDFVQLLVPAAHLHHAQAAEHAGFVVVDVRCELVLERRAYRADASPDTSIRSATSFEVAPIADLAAVCHSNSRFGVDPLLPRSRVEDLYRRWIYRDISTDGWVLAASHTNGALAGYISFGRPSDGDGTIGLVGVAPCARGDGLGARMVSYAAESLFATGCARVKVVTQGGSTPAMKTYQRCGFDVEQLGCWLHWHRRRD